MIWDISTNKFYMRLYSMDNIKTDALTGTWIRDYYSPASQFSYSPYSAAKYKFKRIF